MNMSIKHFQSFEQINKATQYHFYMINSIKFCSQIQVIILGSLPKSHCLSLDLILV
uniref:Uncharacterized protein n=1 Tax=Setaria italica TaxID=4555 RepID=K3ZBR3_SETIT